MKQRVLVVDDEETIRKLLKSKLEREGQEVIVTSSAAEAEAAFKKHGEKIGVMVTDLKMPGKDGLELMKSVKEDFPAVRPIVITGHGEKSVAVQALRNGAVDYLEKPFDMEELTHAVKRALRENQLEQENQDLVGRLEARIERVEGKQEDQSWFVSKAASMEKVNEWLTVLRRESMRGSAEEPTVLVQGASGTGKEGIARMIHAGSRRARGPWVAINCANFTEQLLESELFGHEKGAFTGANSMKRGLCEIARGGTLFLDEIGEMDPKLQARLLRVLQEKTFRRVGGTADIEADIRVIAATNQDLKGGSFREDLYHRLSKIVVDVPPLKDRDDDVVAMAKEFANRAFQNRGKTFQGFTPEAEQGLRNYSWPGNVRELLNIIDRAALVWQGNGSLSLNSLSLPETGMVPENGNGSLQAVTSPFRTPSDAGESGYMNLKKKWCDSFEKEYLASSLQRHGGNVSAAAREAQLDRSNFLRLLRRHGLRAQEYRKAA